jgi:hypothetical protein
MTKPVPGHRGWVEGTVEELLDPKPRESKSYGDYLWYHFKGKAYMVLAEAKHTETGEELVVYQERKCWCCKPSGPVWVRPKTMFLDIVENGKGEKVPRFTYIGYSEPPTSESCGDHQDNVCKECGCAFYTNYVVQELCWNCASKTLNATRKV